jgi:hypothetical protein
LPDQPVEPEYSSGEGASGIFSRQRWPSGAASYGAKKSRVIPEHDKRVEDARPNQKWTWVCQVVNWVPRPL